MVATPATFAALLRTAVTEPGTISTAYSAFHNYSLGNQLLALGQCLARGLQPGPLATCAWLAWALGRSTHAELYARRACDIEPEHGLAEIVQSFVHAGHLPDWAFRRR